MTTSTDTSADGWPSWLPRLSGQALVVMVKPDGAWTPPPPTDPTPQPSTGYATTYPATY